MTTYDYAMHSLNYAIYAAVRAADSEDGAPVEALRKMAADIDSLIDHRCTHEQMRDAEAMNLFYDGPQMAGLTG